MARPDRLEIFYGDERVGSIHDSSPLGFEYEAAWLMRAEPLPVAAIPLQHGRQNSAAVLAFLENLLPEGELRRYVAEQRKASTLFSMLLEVAGDTAGAFVILPAGQTPQPARYEPSSWTALARLRTAAHCGLPTAEVFYEPNTQSCIVRRFDRVARAVGSLGRLVQYDLWQLAGRQPREEPVGVPGARPRRDLAPFHDLICTRRYPGLSRKFAFSIGEETRPGSVTGQHLVAMAQQLRVQPRFVLGQAAELAQKMPAAVEQAVNAVGRGLSPGAKDLAERLRNFVLTTTRKTSVRLAE